MTREVEEEVKVKCEECGILLFGLHDTRTKCFACGPGPNDLYIKNLIGKTIIVPDGHILTVLQVKEYLSRVEDVLVDKIRLVFCGKELENDHSMEDYHTRKDSTLHLIITFDG